MGEDRWFVYFPSDHWLLTNQLTPVLFVSQLMLFTHILELFEFGLVVPIVLLENTNKQKTIYSSKCLIIFMCSLWMHVMFNCFVLFKLALSFGYFISPLKR